jgi:D-alanyl-D-alanine carboxypeptidase/D-alanyl-D-alanine-endopeptidase (penicillin-binding protein 4)
MKTGQVRGTATALLLAAVWGYATPAAPQGATLPPPVAAALAQAGVPESAIGAYAHEVGTTEPFLAVGAERALNPASVMKLVTTYAALELLGPAYVWPTEVYAAGALQQEVLAGDLVLKGHGDPKMTIESFWLLLKNLRSRGVREIRGDLVLDRRYFGIGEGFDPARFDEQPTRPYNTGPDALLVNYKAIRLQFIPEAETRSVRITVEPSLPQVAIVNNLKLDSGACGDWVTRLKLDAQGGSQQARFAFNGSYAASCGERARYFSVLGHQQYIHSLFQELWREMGGTFGGEVRDGTAAGARLLAAVPSQTLSEIARDINKFSNNVMARHVFLTLGAVSGGAPATADKASRAIRQWLVQKGMTAPELVLENGSGLSRIERISAATMGQLLVDAFRSPVMPELIASMPVVAVDGTMRKRLSGAEVAGQAHIKTGGLAGVRSIAGYVLDRNGRRVAVVLIVNHANAGAAHGAQDALLKWVYDREGGACCAGATQPQRPRQRQRPRK